MSKNDKLTFRPLYAEEIECKTTVIANQIELTLHCRAETCTNILNEVVGPMNWEKEYTNNNKNCIVRIWDESKNRMISKEDCGGGLTEIDGLKGQASNGFKRVCALGWGLGIELYSQPKIRIPATEDNITYDKSNQPTVTETYAVSRIAYSDSRKIVDVEIVDSCGNVVYPLTPMSTIPPVKTVIPEPELETASDEEMAIAAAEADIVDELPDNTDQSTDIEDFMGVTPPFETEDYGQVIEREVKRTNTRRSDVLKALHIDTLENIDEVEESLIMEVINKLKARPDFQKRN